MTFGVASMTAPLREVALRRPGKSIVTAEPSTWNYSEHFDPSKIESEYDRFVLVLKNFGVKIHWIKGDDLGNADSVFAYDASLMTPQGAILMSTGKENRRGTKERGLRQIQESHQKSSRRSQGRHQRGSPLRSTDRQCQLPGHR